MQFSDLRHSDFGVTYFNQGKRINYGIQAFQINALYGIGYDYFSTTKELDYIQVGHNFRLSTISASLALSQLNKINKIIDLRRSVLIIYV